MGDAIPGAEWRVVAADEGGFDTARLDAVRRWQSERNPGAPCRVLVIRGGSIVVEWNRGVAADARLPQASAGKSVFSCMLAIAIREGKIGSADDPVVDYYPEMMDVPPGAGPKNGRHAFPANEGITFRQLIGNTSGYMKPGESPGMAFHYQSFGMNILAHAIAARYGLYKSSDPERGAGLGKLVEWRLRAPLQGSWSYRYSNFELPAAARLGIFGYYTNFLMTARDMARLGLLWRHYGRWGDTEVVPSRWLRAATRTSDMVLKAESRENWKYGLGFWTNDKGALWPDLPRNSFAASGAGAQHIWVCPDLDMVVVQSPGSYGGMDPAGAAAVIEKILDVLAW